MLKRLLRSPFFYAFYLMVVTLLILEVITRIYFAFEIGPRVLLYGTSWYRNIDPDENEARWEKTTRDPEYRGELDAHKDAEDRSDSVERHGNELTGYTKFFPNENKSTRDVDTGERIPVTINSHGFRGDEFDTEKPRGVVRVLTLGASSTFGFYDRDDETYPYYLEQLLNESCGAERHFEVINFAVPHASSANIAAMLVAEGTALDPDVVTFYQGRNDSALSRRYETWGEKVYSVMIHRLMLVAFLDQAFVGARQSVTAASETFDLHVKRRSQFYLGNLSRILEVTRENGITFVVANQQATANAPYPRALPERLPLRGVGYHDETQAIRSKIEAGHDITVFEFSLLVHEQLMANLQTWAEENDVPFVDVIEALDQDRHLLLSWVHLHPEANRIVAARLGEVILSEFCPGQIVAGGR